MSGVFSRRGAQPPQPPPPPKPAEPDPSMEDILASIRRILNEGEAGDAPAEAAAAPAAGAAPAAAEPVLLADLPAEPAPTALPETPSATDAAPAKPEDVFILDAQMMVSETTTTEAPAADASPIASSATVAAASQSVGALKKALTERHASIYKGAAVSLEEIVREEVRPMLKDWLDANLPSIVERLVRAEIERVVARELT